MNNNHDMINDTSFLVMDNHSLASNDDVNNNIIILRITTNNHYFQRNAMPFKMGAKTGIIHHRNYWMAQTT